MDKEAPIMIPIDELVGMWVRVHEEALARYAALEHACDSDLSWWREALANLRPDWPEDDATLDEDA